MDQLAIWWWKILPQTEVKSPRTVAQPFFSSFCIVWQFMSGCDRISNHDSIWKIASILELNWIFSCLMLWSLIIVVTETIALQCELAMELHITSSLQRTTPLILTRALKGSAVHSDSRLVWTTTVQKRFIASVEKCTYVLKWQGGGRFLLVPIPLLALHGLIQIINMKQRSKSRLVWIAGAHFWSRLAIADEMFPWETTNFKTWWESNKTTQWPRMGRILFEMATLKLT